MDQVSLVYYWIEDCENCRNAQGLVEKVAEDNDGMIKVFHVDCNEIWKDEEARSMAYLCDPNYHDQLPQISFYQPPLKRVSQSEAPQAAQEVRFSGEASPKSLSQFGHKLMHAFRVRLTTLQDYENFKKKEHQLNKVILFTEKKHTAPIYKALTQLYLGRLHFAEVVENPESNQLMDEFGIDDFPQVYLLERNENGEFTTERYEGDLTWKPLKQFLEQQALPEPIELEHPEDIYPKEETREKRRRGQEGEQKQQEQKTKEEDKPKFKELTEQIFEKELLKNEKPALVQIQKDQENHKAWEELMKKYKSLFDYYTINVTAENEKFVKDQLAARQYPSIRYFTVGNPQKKKATKVLFNNDMNLEEVSKDIQDLIEDRSHNVNVQELQMKMQAALIEGKICLIMFYNTPTVGLTYRVFSQLSDYSDKFRFLSIKNAPKEVIEQFQIRQQPQVIALLRDVSKEDEEKPLSAEQVKMAVYTGKMDYDVFSEFLGNFDENQQKSKLALQEIENQDKLEELCEDKSQLCFIGLLNGEQQKVQIKDKEQTRWDFQLEIMNKIKDKYATKSAQFVYLDASCHEEVLLPLEISDDFLPNYIAYNPLKKQYSKMIGTFDYDSISRFVENHLKGKTTSYTLPQKLEIKKRDCAEVFAEREKRRQDSALSSEDDDILREILEEERKKRELIEKELKAEKKKKKKQNKKKEEDL